MLHQPTVEKLLAIRLEPMVETWRGFDQDENAQQLSFEEKLSLMVDQLWTWRQNQALERRLRYAKLRGNACVEDVDYRASRVMCPSERGPPAAMGRFASSATKRSAAHKYDFVPGNKIVAQLLEHATEIAKRKLMRFQKGPAA